MNTKRKFTREFKQEAVSLVTEQNYTITRAATSLGINTKTLQTWVSLARHQNSGGLNENERDELKRLRKGNKELHLEKEILKKASAFFAKHMS